MTIEAEPERGGAVEPATTAAAAAAAAAGAAAPASGAETAATFAIEGEDHTLANALRFHLNKK